MLGLRASPHALGDTYSLSVQHLARPQLRQPCLQKPLLSLCVPDLCVGHSHLKEPLKGSVPTMSWALSPAELWAHEALLETPGGLPGGGGGQDGGCLTVGQVATPPLQ